MRDDLLKAVRLALANDWHGAHALAQQYHDPMANWLHAVLHKIEGDAWNSKYWYAKTNGMDYERYGNAREELQAIAKDLDALN